MTRILIPAAIGAAHRCLYDLYPVGTPTAAAAH